MESKIWNLLSKVGKWCEMLVSSPTKYRNFRDVSSLKEFVACLIFLQCQWNSNVLNVAQERKSVKNQAGSKVKGKSFPKEAKKLLEIIWRFENSDFTVLYINYTLLWLQTCCYMV